MTKAILTTLTFLIIITPASFSQKKTYFSAEASVTNDVYEISDNGGGLKNIPLLTALVGFNIRQDISKKVFLETGLLIKPYDEGIGFKISSGYTQTNAINAWFIPVRIGSKIKSLKEKIHLVTVLGFTYGINSDYGFGNGGGAGFEKYAGGDSVRYTYASNYNFRKSFPLIQAGLGLEFRLFHTALLSLSSNYYAGLNKIIQQDITYKINNSPEQKATTFSKGDTFGLGIDIKYPISNFWTKPKE